METDISSGRRRGAAPRPQPRRFSPQLIAAVVVLGPMVGTVVGHVAGSSSGPVFVVCCMAAAVFATLASTRAGWWWVLTGLPPVVAVSAIGGELVFHEHRVAYQGTKEQLAGVARGVLHGFPVMAAVEVVMIAIVVTQVLRARQAAPSRPLVPAARRGQTSRRTEATRQGRAARG
jgi:uncharacterized membrane protein